MRGSFFSWKTKHFYRKMTFSPFSPLSRSNLNCMTDEREFLVPKITEILSSLCDFSFVFAVNDKIGLCLHLFIESWWDKISKPSKEFWFQTFLMSLVLHLCYIYVEMRIIVRENTEAIQRLMIQNVPNIITNYFTRRWQT